MKPARLCVRFPLRLLICWSRFVPFTSKGVFHLDISPWWLSGRDSSSTSVNFLRSQLYSYVWAAEGMLEVKSEVGRMLALQMDPYLFIDYR